MGIVSDIAGERFHRLLVLNERRRRNMKSEWLCRCDCGTEVWVRAQSLKVGNTHSCGCLRREQATQLKLSHGQARTRRRRPEYTVWAGMKNRCTNEHDASYPNYGGRGIVVCERWQTFENFYADMGDRPAGGTIERINNDGPYAPDNCRWATRAEQNNNTRNNTIIEFRGESMTLSQWARRVGLKQATLSRRLGLGWSVEDALTLPLQKIYKSAA